ncbi:hypothetical protein HPB49_013807 [Dermacentor silvarum]|uniref:Uncharacterized protein n=1 Tax=Dermacentor silvarum TaxID=543639 RepID=A0ACB8DDQ1_DERSI|nr:hypothetical protein HPB49_013807 [Dermacentor silvarum]
MLRNLATSEQRRLLDCYNNIWWSGQVPEAWRTAIVAPILKSNKPANELSSYRPVSLTSAACKVMEAIALAQLEWVARACGFLADQQTGFRRRRCTADSIADVVSTLEDARASGDLVMLLLIDVKVAFDGLPHAVVQQAVDLLGIGGNLRRFLSSFLNDRTLRVRVGHARSTPRPVAAGVPQGSVVSPFLFNLALARLPAALPTDPHNKVERSIYADDIALWVRGPPQSSRHVCLALQRALDTTAAYLGSIGLSRCSRPGAKEAPAYGPGDPMCSWQQWLASHSSARQWPAVPLTCCTNQQLLPHHGLVPATSGSAGLPTASQSTRDYNRHGNDVDTPPSRMVDVCLGALGIRYRTITLIIVQLFVEWTPQTAFSKPRALPTLEESQRT